MFTWNVFAWRGRLDRRAFVIHAAVAIGYIAALIFGFRYFLYALVTGMKCGDACGVVGIVASSALRPILFYVFLAFVFSICIRRVRDAGLPAWLGAFVPLMALADRTFAEVAGTS